MLSKDRVVIVTGGGSGIGQGIAELLAGDGARVAVAEIHESNGYAVVDSIRRTGGIAEFFRTDVSDEKSVNETIRRVAETFGPVYGLVNNAGVGGREI